jgi:hypothetical protein
MVRPMLATMYEAAPMFLAIAGMTVAGVFVGYGWGFIRGVAACKKAHEPTEATNPNDIRGG